MLQAKLASKQDGQEKTVIRISDRLEIGGNEIVILGGPCAVESREQMDQVATELAPTSIQVMRGCIFKPRTSPYSFQGLGADGVDVLDEVRQKHNLPVITEVMSVEHVQAVLGHVDILQIGSRNMQNFELLKAVGQTDLPVLLKRGLAATLEELLMAAEYIMSQGNQKVILCERGIRSFDPETRNVLDLGAVVALKHLTHLPVVVDPSHAAGKRELVADLARAAVACGADGLIIECHPEPEKSVSDARQALSLADMAELVKSLKPIAEAIGRRLVNTKPNFSVVAGLQSGHLVHQTSETVAPNRVRA